MTACYGDGRAFLSLTLNVSFYWWILECFQDHSIFIQKIRKAILQLESSSNTTESPSLALTWFSSVLKFSIYSIGWRWTLVKDITTSMSLGLQITVNFWTLVGSLEWPPTDQREIISYYPLIITTTIVRKHTRSACLLCFISTLPA